MTHDERDVDTVLREWGRQLRAQATPPVVSLERATSVRPRTGVLVAATVVVLALIGAITFTATRTATKHHESARPRPMSSIDKLVVHDGDEVVADVQIIAVKNEPVVLCNPDAVGAALGSSSTPMGCFGTSINMARGRGVDLTRLSDRQAHQDSVTGEARVRGVLRNGVLRVQRQGRSSSGRASLAAEPRFGCPAPLTSSLPSAVRRRVETEAQTQTSIADRTRPYAIVDVAFHLERTRALVYVLTAGDPAPVRAALRPTYGPALCVVRSRYSRSQINRMRAVFDFDSTATKNPVLLAAGITSSSLGVGPTGQEQLTLNVAKVTPALAKLVDAQPRGLVVVTPWLKPAP